MPSASPSAWSVVQISPPSRPGEGLGERAPMAVDQEEIAPREAFQLGRTLRQLPWWLFIILLIIIYMVVQIIVDPVYQDIFNTILDGLTTTLYVTLVSFVFALLCGLLLGLGRIAQNVVLHTLAITYIEFIRGVPVLVLIFA